MLVYKTDLQANILISNLYTFVGTKPTNSKSAEGEYFKDMRHWLFQIFTKLCAYYIIYKINGLYSHCNEIIHTFQEFTHSLHQVDE